MSLELLNTLGTFLTAAIIAATAVAAIVQLRHLRAGNQINSMLSISNQFDRREFRDAMHVIRYKLGGAMEDPLFREYLLARNRAVAMPAVPDEFHQIGDAFALVGNTFGELGIFVKNDIIERRIFLERFAFTINLVWDRMVRRSHGFAQPRGSPHYGKTSNFLRHSRGTSWAVTGARTPNMCLV